MENKTILIITIAVMLLGTLVVLVDLIFSPSKRDALQFLFFLFLSAYFTFMYIKKQK